MATISKRQINQSEVFELWLLIRPGLKRYCRYAWGGDSRIDTDDILGVALELFVRDFTSLPDGLPVTEIELHAYRIAKNKLRNAYRHLRIEYGRMDYLEPAELEELAFYTEGALGFDDARLVEIYHDPATHRVVKELFNLILAGEDLDKGKLAQQLGVSLRMLDYHINSSLEKLGMKRHQPKKGD